MAMFARRIPQTMHEKITMGNDANLANVRRMRTAPLTRPASALFSHTHTAPVGIPKYLRVVPESSLVGR
jgi:hypothetical protein